MAIEPGHGGTQAENPRLNPSTDGTGNPFGPHRWPMDHLIQYGGSSANASPEKTVSTGTILDNVIPAVYGSRRVTAHCGARFISATGLYATLGFVLCYGEQQSVTSVKVNGKDPTGASWLAWSPITHTGDGSTVSGYLTGLTGWTSADTTRWEGLAHIVLRIYLLDPDCPSSFNVTALVGGQEVVDFRTSSDVFSDNPALVAYDLLTNTGHGLGLATSRVDTAEGWEEVADWADENPGDDTDRWAYAGIVEWRDPDAALREVLSHCFAELYPTIDGKIGLWAEKPPVAITGDWTGTTATIQEAGAVGNALAEVSAGDRLLLDTSTVRTVVSVPNDDTIILDQSVTVTAVRVRPISVIHIAEENWVRLPECTELDKATLPDYFRARYTDGDVGGSYYEEDQYGSGTAKRLEQTFSGCTVAAQAARLAAMSLNLDWLQPFMFSGVADGVAADLTPGAVFTFDTDVIDGQLARVSPPVIWNQDGTYSLTFREFDLNAYTGNETADQPISVDPNLWELPDAPTACTQLFGESGSWDTYTLAPNANRITEGAGYTASNIVATYVSGDVATELYLDSPNTSGYIGWEISTGLLVAEILVSIAVRFIEDSDADVTWALEYRNGSTLATATVKKSWGIDPLADGEWIRIAEVFTLESSGNHYITISATDSGTPPSAGSEETIEVKRLRAVYWGHNTELGLYERWTWTEHVDADETVWSYRVIQVYEWGPSEVIAVTPVGTTSIEFPVIIGGLLPVPIGPQYVPGIVRYDMEARGPGGRTMFPAPTQSFGDRARIPVSLPSGEPIISPSPGTTDYIDDFESYSLGTLDTVTGDKWTIDTDASGGDPVITDADSSDGGQNITKITSTGGYGYVWWNEHGDIFNPSAGTIKITFQMKVYADWHSWVGLFPQDSQFSDGYALGWSGISGGAGQHFNIQKWVSSSGQWSSDWEWGTPGTGAYWAAIEIDPGDSKVRGKAWTGAIEDEPGTWDVEHTDTSIINDDLCIGCFFGAPSGTPRFTRVFYVQVEAEGLGGAYTPTGREVLRSDGDTTTLGGTDLNTEIDGAAEVLFNSGVKVADGEKIIGEDGGTEFDLLQIDTTSGDVIAGDVDADMELRADGEIKLNLATSGADSQFLGWLSGSGSPTTTELPNDHDWCIWEDTSAVSVGIYFNDGGTIRQA